MAERRMFAKTIIDSDGFLDLPLSTQALYFHLSMRADDDGFVNNPKKILRMTGATHNEIELLLDKRFILLFESGVIVIKHWRMHNYIQADRYKPTVYQEELQKIKVKGNQAYTDNVYTMDTDCIQNGHTGKVRIGKSSLGETSQGKDIYTLPQGDKKRFVPPTVDEVRDHCFVRHFCVDAEEFVAFYESKGWMVGRSKMKDWKACCVTWDKRAKKDLTGNTRGRTLAQDLTDTSWVGE
jgi:hypothetical protein